jgi:hypothetical protein
LDLDLEGLQAFQVNSAFEIFEIRGCLLGGGSGEFLGECHAVDEPHSSPLARVPTARAVSFVLLGDVATDVAIDEKIDAVLGDKGGGELGLVAAAVFAVGLCTSTATPRD